MSLSPSLRGSPQMYTLQPCAVRSHHDGQRKPSVATLHDVNVDPFDVGPERHGEWRMHHADVLSIVHESSEAREIRKRLPNHLALHVVPQRCGAGRHR